MIARIVSTLVLAPIALLAIHLGPPASDGLLMAIAGVMAWEWGRLCSRDRSFGLGETALVAGTLAAVGAGALLGFGAAVIVSLVACLAVVLSGVLPGSAATAGDPRGGAGRRSRPIWLGFGLLYLALPVLALQWLRGPGGAGELSGGLETSARLQVFWLFALVWATDVGAFFTGRTLGGPKLWARVSPNKTWAGMVGGLASAGLVGAAFSAAAGPGAFWPLVAASLLLSLVSQAGDFFESAIKRRFGAKDTSGLIPGHGGLIDRLDGLLAATLVLAFLAWLGKSPLQ